MPGSTSLAPQQIHVSPQTPHLLALAPSPCSCRNHLCATLATCDHLLVATLIVCASTYMTMAVSQGKHNTSHAPADALASVSEPLTHACLVGCCNHYVMACTLEASCRCLQTALKVYPLELCLPQLARSLDAVKSAKGRIALTQLFCATCAAAVTTAAALPALRSLLLSLTTV